MIWKWSVYHKKKIQESGLFDATFYEKNNPDVDFLSISPLQHFIHYGWREKRNPNPLFDIDYYLSTNTDAASIDSDPLLHFIQCGSLRSKNPHPLFDVSYYKRTNNIVAKNKINPLTHFLREGGRTLSNPHPLFDSRYFLQCCPEAQESPLLPVVYYCQFGHLHQQGPHPLLDYKFYLSQFSNDSNLNIDPLIHFCEEGYKTGKDPGPLFSTAYYYQHYPDVRLAGINPLSHFVQNGWREHRDPSPDFSVKQYLELNEDVIELQIDPLSHYVLFGRKEGRRIFTDATTVPSASLLAPRTIVTDESFYQSASKFLHVAQTYSSHINFPQFSIVMPTHNRGNLICKAIDSVLMQHYPYFELIIVDDGSTDNTSAIIKQRYQKQLSTQKVRYMPIPKSGLGDARNVGVLAAHFNWIAYLDSDNQWLENTLTYIAYTISTNGSYKTFYGNICHVDKDKNIVGKSFSFRELLHENFIDLNAYVHAREIIFDCGFFDTTLTRLIDYDLVIRHTRKYSPVYIPVVLVNYHHCGDSVTQTVNGVINQDRINRKQQRYNTTIHFKIPASFDTRDDSTVHRRAKKVQTCLAAMNYTVATECVEQRQSNINGYGGHINLVIQGATPYTPNPKDKNILVVPPLASRLSATKYNKFDAIVASSGEWIDDQSDTVSIPCYELELFFEKAITQSMQLPPRVDSAQYEQDGHSDSENHPKSLFKKAVVLAQIFDSLNQAESSVVPDNVSPPDNILDERNRSSQIGIIDINRAANKLQWRVRLADKLDSNSAFSPFDGRKICLHVHAVDIAMLETLMPHIAGLSAMSIDIFVTTSSPNKTSSIKTLLKQHQLAARLEVLPSKSENIDGHLMQFGLMCEGYEYICHIHTDLNSMSHFDELWLTYLVTNLLRHAPAIIHKFDATPELGLYYPVNYPLVINDNQWDGSYPLVTSILKAIGVYCPLGSASHPVESPRGGMYWVRTKSIKQLFLNADNIKQEQFTTSPRPALERAFECMLPKVVTHNGFCSRSFLPILSYQGISEPRSRILLYALDVSKSPVDDTIIDQLGAMKSVAESIHVICSYWPGTKARSRIRSVTGRDIVIHSGPWSDTSAWKALIRRIRPRKLHRFRDVILMNNACLGPILDMRPMFDQMEKKACHFWGITGEEHCPPGDGLPATNQTGLAGQPFHIHPYFIVFKREAVATQNFAQFWRSTDSATDLIDESFSGDSTTDGIEATHFFANRGYIPAVYIQESLKLSLTHASCDNLPELYLPLGAPLLKREKMDKYLRTQKISDIVEDLKRFCPW
ncbi:MAG: glycosyltransferase [Deltaproteobacteria bacterium]|nr:glycosyltransferase [Deltaproteobacteria bacterium]